VRADPVSLLEPVAEPGRQPWLGKRLLIDVPRDRRDLGRTDVPAEVDTDALPRDQHVGVLDAGVEPPVVAPELGVSKVVLGDPLERLARLNDVPSDLVSQLERWLLGRRGELEQRCQQRESGYGHRTQPVGGRIFNHLVA